jgi:hypothetical protein
LVQTGHKANGSVAAAGVVSECVVTDRGVAITKKIIEQRMITACCVGTAPEVVKEGTDTGGCVLATIRVAVEGGVTYSGIVVAGCIAT